MEGPSISSLWLDLTSRSKIESASVASLRNSAQCLTGSTLTTSVLGVVIVFRQNRPGFQVVAVFVARHRPFKHRNTVVKGLLCDVGVTRGFNLRHSLVTQGRIVPEVKVDAGTGAHREHKLASANGSYGLLGVTGPFSTGYGDATSGLKFVGANGFTRFDNTITYMTPSFAGLTVYAQYSMDTNGTDGSVENESSSDRYYGIGAKFVAGGLTLVGVVDSINYATWPSTPTNQAMDDALTVTLGGNYDFQVAKVYFGGQYFDNAKTVATTNVIVDANKAKIGSGYTLGSLGAEGWGLGLGVGVPVMGGTASAYAGYLDADSVDDSDASLKRFTGAVGYSYTFSKRTSMYSTLSYTKDEYKANGTADKVKPTSVEAIVGLIHKF